MTGWVFLWLALWTFLPFSGIMVSDQYQDYLQTFRKGVLFMANIHDKHRQRLRKRFLQEGLSSFEPHQVLELLLTYAIPRKDVNPTAHDLLNTFGTIDKVFDAPFNALTKIDGVGDVTASLLKLVPELSACYIDSKNKGMKVLDTTEKLKEFLIPKFLGKTVECSCLLSLNSRLQLLNYSMISEGTVTSTPFPIRQVTDLLLRHRATAAVIAHNHPNGFTTPSKADFIVTQELYRYLQKMEVKLIDHIIISGQDGLSMREEGYFQTF